MASRRDLISPRAFEEERLTSALLARDADAGTRPFRRTRLGLLGGLMIAITMMGAAGIAGGRWPTLGDDSWRSNGTVVVVDGARTQRFLVYDKGRLRPVTDLTTARIFAGTLGVLDPPIAHVGPRAVLGIPTDTMLTVPGAPATLPAAAHVKISTLDVCAAPAVTGATRRVVVAGFDAPTPTDHEVSLGVVDEKGVQWLVMKGRAHRLPGTATAASAPSLTALGLEPVRGADALLAAIPTGDPISLLSTPGLHGKPVRAASATARVGDIFVSERRPGPTARYYVQRHAGTVRVPYAMAIAMSVSLRRSIKYAPVAALASAVDPAQATVATDVPFGRPTRPARSVAHSPVCAAWRPGNGVPLVIVPVATPAVATPAAGITPSSSQQRFDQVTQADGSAILLSGSGQECLLVVGGRSYRLPDQRSRTVLGYGNTSSRSFPQRLLDAIPAGEPAGVTLSAQSLRPA